MVNFSEPTNEIARSESAGVQSIEVGATLLRVLARSNGPMKLRDLASAVGMSSSRAHKYLTSFLRCGLVRQDGLSNRYDIGPLATELGLSALRRIEVVEMAQETLDDLRDRVKTVVSMAIWSNQGPTIIRRAVHQQHVSLVVQLGAVLNVLASSNGRVLAAYMGRTATEYLIKKELAEKNGLAKQAGIRNMRDVDVMLAQVRTDGYAATSGTMLPGIASVSAPVFDYSGKIAASLTLIATAGALDFNPQGKPILTLQRSAAGLSTLLGAPSHLTGAINHDIPQRSVIVAKPRQSRKQKARDRQS